MISGIILAAGQSKRMGEPKMLLPWGGMTVIEHVVATFLGAGVGSISVITGAAHEEIEAVIGRFAVRSIHNRGYAVGEMLSSLQQGLKEMPDAAQAALIGLGDQPQVQASSIRMICEAYVQSKSRLVVPSFQRKRGHPWLVARPLWDEILRLRPPRSPRDFLNQYADEIQYVNVDTPSILADLDTPDDYRRARP